MIQVRLKLVSARTLVEVTRALLAALEVPVIVNDRADIALAAGAAGVHLGADDVPAGAIRRIAPAGFVIGASIGSVEEVANAAAADYVGIGPAFATSTKNDAGAAIGPEGISALVRLCGKPAVAIGGIGTGNVAALSETGCVGIAVVRAILGSPDPESAARSFMR